MGLGKEELAAPVGEASVAVICDINVENALQKVTFR
ncbi:hypothetical protein AGR3A_Cc280008 [Agrobacterium tomkonis CFBP 6623]|uniref:Uncharacterized protein n=1 Tax=Agrobacterium tomkonis CFBP 6623 TaxID=1183432 RepID=A0A1S7PNF4_9HYPH|nr:hypothetical protein AGR3A_Cc280008 [Agrobacterium tomkonis CFBP 6623]